MAVSKSVKFYSQYNRPPRVKREYSEEIPVFSLVIENDKPKLKEVGKTNYQEQIEKSCSFHTVKQLIERFKRGDVSALNSKSGFFGDITSMPDSMLAARKIIDSTFSAYNSMDKDVKAKFGDYQGFLKSFGDGSYIKILEDIRIENSKGVSNSDKVPDLQGSSSVQKEEEVNE